MRIFILLVALLATGCSRSNYQETVYVKYVDNIINNHKRQAARENLVLFGSGGWLFSDVDKITITYQSHRLTTIDEARDQFVRLAIDLIDKMNTHSDIQPYLRDVPSTIKNIKLAIHYPHDPSTRDLVRCVTNYGDRVEYLWFPDRAPIIVLYKESFDEAVSRANQ